MATVKWQKVNPKVQGNVPLDIHKKFAEYAASRGLSESKAMAEILKRFFQDLGAYPELDSNHPSDNPMPCVGLSEVMEKLRSLTPSSASNDLALEESSHSLEIKNLSQQLELALTRIDSMLELFSTSFQQQQVATIQSALAEVHNIDLPAGMTPEDDHQQQTRVHQSVPSFSPLEFPHVKSGCPVLTWGNKTIAKYEKLVLVADQKNAFLFRINPPGRYKHSSRKGLIRKDFFFEKAVLCNGNDIRICSDIRVHFLEDYSDDQLTDPSTIGIIWVKQAILQSSRSGPEITPEFTQSGNLLGENYFVVLKQVGSTFKHTLLSHIDEQIENPEERQTSLIKEVHETSKPLELSKKSEQLIFMEMELE